MKKVSLIFSLLVWIITSSCSVDRVSVTELQSYVLDPDHGTVSTLEKNNITLQASFYPKDLILEQDLGTQDPKGWARESLALDSIDYFALRLSRDKKEIESRYLGTDDLTSVQTYLNHLGDHVYLQLGDEKIVPEESVYYSGNGTTNATTILLIFKNGLLRRSGKVSLIFEDTFFRTGRNEFEFSLKDLKNVPALKRKEL